MAQKRYDFLTAAEKRVTLLGMSGVGKTTLANMLAKNGWFHYSGDVQIGRHHLKDEVPDSDRITVKNLAPLSLWLGRLGDAEKGGRTLTEFKRRLALHHHAEIAAMLDVPQIIAQAQRDGFSNFINDAGGSLCELDAPEVLDTLAAHTLIVYIKATKNEEDVLMHRALAHPKPLYYPEPFLDGLVADYLSGSGETNPDAIDPDDFFRFAFPKLFQARLPKYDAIAQHYGVTISTTALRRVRNGNDFIELVEKA